MSNYNPTITGATAAYGSSTVANVWLAAEILVSRVSQEAAQRAFLADLVWNEGVIAKETMTAHFRYVDPLTATVQTATEGVALPIIAWAPVGKYVTAGLNGFSLQISKLMSGLSPSSLDEIAMQAGSKLARDKEIAIALLFPSGTAGTVNRTTAALRVQDIQQGEAYLDASYADAQFGPRYGAVHSNQFYDLKKDMVTLNYGVSRITADAQGNDLVEIGSITIMKNNLVPTANSNVDYCGALFVRDFIGITEAQLPSVEILPIPGSHSWTVDATEAFAAGVIRPAFGVPVISGKTA